MNNKILFLSSLFLFVCITECMKRKIEEELTLSQPSTMQELQNKRNTFKQKLIKIHTDNPYWWLYGKNNEKFLSCTYHVNLHKTKINLIAIINDIDEEEIFFGFYNINNIKKISAIELEILQKTRCSNNLYSCLGSATMAEEVSHEEKKEFIQKLLTLGFTPTPEDKKLAILATYEEFGSSIIEKKMLLNNFLVLTEMNVPQEIKDYIALIMFETELLF